MKLRSGKTYSYTQPRELKHLTSIGFFDKAIPIDLHVIPGADIEKIDMRIKRKPNEQHKSQLIDCVGHFEQTRRIYVSTTCYNEIISKLYNHASILRINGNKTEALQAFVKSELEVNKFETTKVKMDVKYDPINGIWYEGNPSFLTNTKSNEPTTQIERPSKQQKVAADLASHLANPSKQLPRGYNPGVFKANDPSAQPDSMVKVPHRNVDGVHCTLSQSKRRR